MLLKKLILTAQILLPRSCVLCGYLSQCRQNICADCYSELPILPHHCRQCARFLPDDMLSQCGECLQISPPFSRILALFPYEMPIIAMIKQLKFKQRLYYAKTFADLFQARIQHDWYHTEPLPDLILPMPLHTQRLGERGFNQAVEMARPIAKKFKLSLDTQGIIRHKATAAQSGLSADARKKNIANAFTIQRDYSGLSIALLDDVVTTGSTVTELCHALKISGAKKIEVWCCARRG